MWRKKADGALNEKSNACTLSISQSEVARLPSAGRRSGIQEWNGDRKRFETFSLRLLTLAPEIGDASRSATLDTSLQQEIAEYVKNLRALQGALEKVRCVMLARQVQLGAAKGRMDRLQGWVTWIRKPRNWALEEYGLPRKLVTASPNRP